MYKIISLVVFFTALISCKQKPSENAQLTENPATVKAETYGAGTDSIGALSVADAMKNLTTKDTIVCKVNGYVTGVCQVKGCWMMISQNPGDSIGLFVKFKDYGFFMPKDLLGSKIVMNGFAYKEVTPVDELKHYAEDEGKSKEEIDGIVKPQEKMKFMSEGVMVLDRKHNGK